MQDRPTYSELLDAVQHFLETDVVPVLDGPKKFHARVAANVLAIVRRELEAEEAQLREEWHRLDALLGSSERPPAERDELRHRLRQRTVELCDEIRRGGADHPPRSTTVLAHVRHTVLEKLAVSNPKYLGNEINAPKGARD